MENKRSKRKSAIITFISVIIIILIFIFLPAFTTPLPLPEEEGVVLEISGGGGGGGSEYYEDFIPDVSENVASGENYVTDNSNNVNYNTSNNNTNNNTNTNNSNQNTVDPRLQNFNWGQGGGDGSGTGTGTGTGSGNGTGVGPGNGPAFSLNGRSAKSIPVPKYTEDDQGKVVVKIWVDKNGNVTRAEPGDIGTTTSNQSLWAKAKQAALQAKFSVDMNAPEIQRGTITYTFIKLN